MTRYAFIGDVHSQAEPLQKALEYCKLRRLTPILLGDLFDSRCTISDSAKVFNLVRKAQRMFPGMVTLRSNHQNKLERYIKGNPVNLSPDLEKTLADFANAGLSLQGDILPWLLSFPFGFVFRDSKGTEYRCAHACFPSRIEVQPYTKCRSIWNVTRKEKDLMLYGPRFRTEGGTNERSEWWLKPAEREWVRVAGHYHVVHMGPKSLVLDGDMGGRSQQAISLDDMALCLYDVEAQELKRFGV
jgi:hypothetical protein